MKKTVKQLKDSKNEALANMQALVDLAESEDRNLTADEQTAWNEAEKTATDMTERVDRLERSLNLTKTPITPIHHNLQDIKKTDKDLQKFRFTDAAIAAYNGSMSGLVREMHQEAQNENKGRLFRGVGIPSIALEQRTDLPGASSDVKPTDAGSFIDQLQANLTLGSIANFYSGLSADRKFPIVDGISTSFVAESPADAVDPAGSLTNITLSPKKMISVVSMSAEMMTQNASSEAALQRNMTASIAATWEEALLHKDNQTGAPTSFWKAGLDSGATDTVIADLYTLEQKMLEGEFNPANSRFAYLFNPAAIAALKSGLGNESGQNFQVFNNNATVNSIPYYVTSLLGKDETTTKHAAIVSGANMHLATFGGLDVISDRYTDAAKGLSRLVIVNLVDAAMSRIASTGTVSSFIKADA